MEWNGIHIHMKVTSVLALQWTITSTTYTTPRWKPTQIAKFTGPIGSCRPQMGPMLAPWTLLSGQRTAVSQYQYWDIWQRFCTKSSILTELLTHWPLADVEIILQVYFKKLISWIEIMSTSCAIGLRLVSSTWVQEMVWCRQTLIHFLNQCWQRSPTPHH